MQFVPLKKHRLAGFGFVLTVMLLGTMLYSWSFIPQASACIKPILAKVWVNSAAKEKDLVRLKIDYNCGEKPIKSYDPLSASLWIVRGFMKCGRAECIWGRAKGTMINSSEMHVTFSSFSMVRDIKLFYEGGLLRVDVVNNYRDKRRKPTKQSYYLHPEQ